MCGQGRGTLPPPPTPTTPPPPPCKCLQQDAPRDCGWEKARWVDGQAGIPVPADGMSSGCLGEQNMCVWGVYITFYHSDSFACVMSSGQDPSLKVSHTGLIEENPHTGSGDTEDFEDALANNDDLAEDDPQKEETADAGVGATEDTAANIVKDALKKRNTAYQTIEYLLGKSIELYEHVTLTQAAQYDKVTVTPVTEDKATVTPVTDDKATVTPVTDDKATVTPVTDDKATVTPVTDDKATVTPVTDDKATVAPLGNEVPSQV